MQKLERRIAELERVQPHAEPMTIIRRIVSPDNLHAAINHIRAADQVWVRKAGESEQDFTDRATREAKPNPWGCVQRIASESRETHRAIN